MTVKEFYEWAVANDAADYTIEIPAFGERYWTTNLELEDGSLNPSLSMITLGY